MASPDEVLADVLGDLPEGAYLSAAVVIVEYHVPGADDEDERGPFLATRRDAVAGAWTHLGMVASARGDLSALLLELGE